MCIPAGAAASLTAPASESGRAAPPAPSTSMMWSAPSAVASPAPPQPSLLAAVSSRLGALAASSPGGGNSSATSSIGRAFGLGVASRARDTPQHWMLQEQEWRDRLAAVRTAGDDRHGGRAHRSVPPSIGSRRDAGSAVGGAGVAALATGLAHLPAHEGGGDASVPSSALPDEGVAVARAGVPLWSRARAELEAAPPMSTGTPADGRGVSPLRGLLTGTLSMGPRRSSGGTAAPVGGTVGAAARADALMSYRSDAAAAVVDAAAAGGGAGTRRGAR